MLHWNVPSPLVDALYFAANRSACVDYMEGGRGHEEREREREGEGGLKYLILLANLYYI